MHWFCRSVHFTQLYLPSGQSIKFYMNAIIKLNCCWYVDLLHTWKYFKNKYKISVKSELIQNKPNRNCFVSDYWKIYWFLLYELNTPHLFTHWHWLHTYTLLVSTLLAQTQAIEWNLLIFCQTNAITNSEKRFFFQHLILFFLVKLC